MMDSSHGDIDYDLDNQDDDGVDPSFLSVLDEEFEYSTDFPGTKVPDVDLYAVLGVDRSADEQEIRAAYRKLSRLLHPDKHQGSGDSTGQYTEDAQNAFSRIATAYAILSDKDKRAIYDQYGSEGLNMSGWEMVVHDKSPAQLRLEFIKLRALEKEQEQMSLIRPESHFSLGIDATDLFDRFLQEDPQDRYESPQFHIYELSMTQSANVFSALNHNVNAVGHVTAHKGVGVGMLALNWRYHCPKKSIIGPAVVDTEVSHGKAGHHLCTSVKVSRDFGDRWSLFTETKLGFNLRPRGLMLAPTVTVGASFSLAPNVIARIEYTEFIGGKLASSIEWNSLDRKTTMRLKVYLKSNGNLGMGLFTERVVNWSIFRAPFGSGVSYNTQEEKPSEKPSWASEDMDEDVVSQPLDGRLGRVSIGADINTRDVFQFTLGAKCAISKFSNLAVLLSTSLTTGINLRCTLFRGSQSYSIPLKLSNEPNVCAFGYGFVVPLVTFVLVRRMVYEPWLRNQMQKSERFRRKKLKEELCKRRREALAVQALMEASAVRSKDLAADVSGLIITKALFGKLCPKNPFDPLEEDDGGALAIDVTIPLQCMVVDNHLTLPPTKWCDLQGFYDPCLGLMNHKVNSAGRFMRQLAVQYEFHRQNHVVIVDEGKGLAIPMTKHLQSQ